MTGTLGGDKVTFVTGERLLSGKQSADDEWRLLAGERLMREPPTDLSQGLRAKSRRQAPLSHSTHLGTISRIL